LFFTSYQCISFTPLQIYSKYIKNYFKEGLGVRLGRFRSDTAPTARSRFCSIVLRGANDEAAQDDRCPNNPGLASGACLLGETEMGEADTGEVKAEEGGEEIGGDIRYCLLILRDS